MINALRDVKAQPGGSSWRRRLGGLVAGGRTMRSLFAAAKLKRHDTTKIIADGAIWEQGDEALYTEDAVAKRAALRNHSEIQECLQLWWDTALHSVRRDDQEAEAEKRRAAAATSSVVCAMNISEY